jgi:hypothetical protein
MTYTIGRTMHNDTHSAVEEIKRLRKINKQLRNIVMNANDPHSNDCYGVLVDDPTPVCTCGYDDVVRDSIMVTTECDDCDPKLVDFLAASLTDVIGKHVPENEQNNWNNVLLMYINYKEGNKNNE